MRENQAKDANPSRLCIADSSGLVALQLDHVTSFAPQLEKQKAAGCVRLSPCPEAPGAFNGRTEPSIRHPGNWWLGVSKPGCKTLNQSNSTGFVPYGKNEEKKHSSWIPGFVPPVQVCIETSHLTKSFLSGVHPGLPMRGVLDMSGVALGLAAQVHLAASIRLPAGPKTRWAGGFKRKPKEGYFLFGFFFRMFLWFSGPGGFSAFRNPTGTQSRDESRVDDFFQ